MQTIQTQITDKYGERTWDVIQPHVQDIARGDVTISELQDITGLTEWKARSTCDTIKEFIYVPENKVYNEPLGGMQKWLLLPDVHRPFHNRILWGKLLQLIWDMGSDLYGLMFLGDYLDAYTIGSYNDGSLYNLEGRTLGQEYEEGSEGLDQIDDALYLGAKKVFLYGNHEERFMRHIKKGDNAKYGSALLSPTEGLRLRERDYEVLDNYGQDYYLLGDHLEAIHGDYTNKYCSEKHLRLGGGSYIFGHSHVIQSYHQGDMASFCIGWLGNKEHPVYSYTSRLGRKKWANGFAFVYIDDNGDYHVQQVTVWDNKFYANGRMY